MVEIIVVKKLLKNIKSIKSIKSIINHSSLRPASALELYWASSDSVSGSKTSGAIQRQVPTPTVMAVLPLAAVARDRPKSATLAKGSWLEDRKGLDRRILLLFKSSARVNYVGNYCVELLKVNYVGMGS